MKKIYPNYYKKFKCIANRCPDSCCQGWDVVVDEESEIYYNGISGGFGDKIREVTAIDEDGDRIFSLKNGKCPFWNEDKLCDIYINLGEEHLCATCKKFPRITMDYECFKEYTLSLACPESAKLILSEDFTIPDNFQNYNFSDVGYNGKIMKFLLNARIKSAEILSNKNLPFNQNLINCLKFNKEIQNIFSPLKNENVEKYEDFSFLFKIYERLEFIDKSYCEKIKNASKFLPSRRFDKEFRRLSIYYIYRYYLNAIETLDVLSAVKQIVCAYIVIGALARSENDSNIIKITQTYSKEVEHSYENMETLQFFFENSDGFKINNLIELLNF